MARLTDEKREDIKNALILGESQYNAAKKFSVSSATINKIFKSIGEDEFLVKEVKAETAIKSALNTKSERLVKAFDDKVNESLRRQNLVYGFQEKAIKRAGEMLEMTEAPQDLKHLVDAVDKASITLKVSDRHAPKTEINNTNATQNNTDIKRVTIARRSDRDD